MKAARILVVDDDEFVRDLIKETLSLESYEVLLASDGREGLRRVEHDRPDVVLLDVRLGGEVDGLEVCRSIARAEGAPRVIFLTGMADNADVEAGYQAGGCAYLTKPFSPLELIESIEAALAGVR